MNIKIKNFIAEIIVLSIILTITYLFLCLCNWDFRLSEWNGFSRFIIGFVGIITIIKIIDKF